MSLKCPGPLLSNPSPVDPAVLASRQMLLDNGTFMDLFDRTGSPSLVLTLDHQVVLANQAMVDKLGLDSDEPLVGSIPGDLAPCASCQTVKTRTWSIEVQERAFLIMNLDCPATMFAPVFAGGDD